MRHAIFSLRSTVHRGFYTLDLKEAKALLEELAKLHYEKT